MAYHIPLPDDPRREMFDMHDLVDIGTGDKMPLTLTAARMAAKRTFESYGRSIKRLNYIVLRADDRLQLVSIGRRGGWKVVWAFGDYRLPAKLRSGYVPPIAPQMIQTVMKG